MEKTTAEKRQNEISPQTYRAAELFSKLPDSVQDDVISLIKALLSRE